MHSTNVLRSLSFLTITIAALAGCIIENDPPRHIHDHDSDSPPPAATSGESSSGSTTPAPGTPAPMLVEVDTDQTMTADPGQGVGVFVEYARGGRWHVWWTCDTDKTHQNCDFTVSATAAAGNVSNVDATHLEGGLVSTPTPSRVDAKITTSTQAHGISFSTNPGAVVTLEASVGGIKDGSFLFFVQDGKVNGGFTGRLTNPLQLQGKSP